MTTRPLPAASSSRSADRRRHADPRRGLQEIVRGLADPASANSYPRDVGARLTDAVRSVLPIRRIELEDAYVHSVPPSSATAVLRVDVPLPPGTRPLVLAITRAPHFVLDGWDEQLLQALPALAALLLCTCHAELATDLPTARTTRRPPSPELPIVGSSEAMQAVQRLLTRVARRPFPVLIEGESGTGKELVARRLHVASPRRHGPYVAVNCAALVDSLLEAELFGIEDRTATGVRARPGKFEAAHGGTLFLDEVADLSAAAQAKLLRVLQDCTVERVGSHQGRTFDVRVVAATNQSLRALVARRRFREDLYHRLAGVVVAGPPLRDRGTDVVELARHFLRRHEPDRAICIAPAAADRLLAHRWPGNVRELERVVQRALVVLDGDVLEPAHLVLDHDRPGATPAKLSWDRRETLAVMASRYVRHVVSQCRTRAEAARVLGVSLPTLRAYLRSPSARSSAKRLRRAA
jgi:DNA-binding NtrC family response regulator